MTKTSRTVTIYRPDEFSYCAIFSGTDRAPETRIYHSERELMQDASEHLKLECPCICRGKEYSGEQLHGLLMAISSCEGSTSILFNTARPYTEAAELFRDALVSDIVKEY